MNPSLQMLLNRVEFVRPAGDDQWRGKCPVHGGSGRDSLSIKSCGDGRILIHCFSGCEPLEILKVCGLEMGDIMPEKLTHHASPAEKKKWREAATMRDWKKSLGTIQHEARVVWIAGRQLQHGKLLDQTDSARLDEALESILQEGKKLHAFP